MLLDFVIFPEMSFRDYGDISVLDSIMSLAVALFILFNALKELKKIAYIFLEKTPEGISVKVFQEQIMAIDGVLGVHHIHIWSMDGYDKYVTLHVVTDNDAKKMKDLVRNQLRRIGITHATIELETSDDDCDEKNCRVMVSMPEEHQHQHQHQHQHYHH